MASCRDVQPTVDAIGGQHTRFTAGSLSLSLRAAYTVQSFHHAAFHQIDWRSVATLAVGFGVFPSQRENR